MAGMRTILEKRYLIFASRALLAVVFIFASLDKLVMPEAFASSIQGYALLPLPIVNLAALVIPWLELLCGLFLLTGVRIRSSALLLVTLLCIFAIAMMAALARGLAIDCGCFGKAYVTPVSWARVAEDLGLIVLGLHCVFFGERRSEPPATPGMASG